MSEALVVGSSWSILIRWTSRFLGIISLAVCARILTPADYGLVNMAMVIVAFSAILVEFGIDASLIREQNPTKETYNTAWSLRIIQSLIVATIVIVASPIAASLYKDPRVIPIMIAVAVAGLIGGMQNIYVVLYRKTLNFRSDFVLSILPKIASFTAAIVSVLLLKSYWGLVIGICVAELSKVLVSYVMMPKRASWSLSEWRSLTSFSGWYFLKGVGDFFTYEFDRFLVGTLAGPRQTGLYAVGKEIASLPATEIILPIGRALLPTLSRIVDERERFGLAVEKAIVGTLILTAPAAVGFALIAPEFVQLLFGSGWKEAVILVTIFSIGSIFSGFKVTVANVLLITGKIRTNALISWIQAGLALGFFYPAYLMGGTEGIAVLYVVVGILTCLMYGFILHFSRLVNTASLLKGIARPLIASVLMYLFAVWLIQYLNISASLILLVAKMLIGVLAYSAFLAILWLLAGSPRSSERVIASILYDKIEALMLRKFSARS
ncbi:oligosaccharide flippase family protein [Hydrogenophaga sp. RAC07]|uniref:oligosaccharide flippase family protein n=1 Tax=Hydrogenophaga sp. RAC07 TaxID=1842537 RepID=UPI0015609B13|nr:oligosaccharide flippase family protein [Hydrogenophaga sp. RAC07]